MARQKHHFTFYIIRAVVAGTGCEAITVYGSDDHLWWMYGVAVFWWSLIYFLLLGILDMVVGFIVRRISPVR